MRNVPLNERRKVNNGSLLENAARRIAAADKNANEVQVRLDEFFQFEFGFLLSGGAQNDEDEAESNDDEDQSAKKTKNDETED